MALPDGLPVGLPDGLPIELPDGLPVGLPIAEEDGIEPMELDEDEPDEDAPPASEVAPAGGRVGKAPAPPLDVGRMFLAHSPTGTGLGVGVRVGTGRPLNWETKALTARSLSSFDNPTRIERAYSSSATHNL